MSPPAEEKMEDGKQLAASANSPLVHGENGDPADCRFSEFCKNGLSLDDESCRQAMKLFTETKHLLQTNASSIGNGTHEEAERYWFSFVLYCIKRLAGKHTDSEKKVTDSNGPTLCQILRKAKLKYITGPP